MSGSPSDPYYALGSLDRNGSWRFSFYYWGYARAESFLETPRLVGDHLIDGVAFGCELYLRARRASDGAQAWSHSVKEDLLQAASGTLGSCSFGHVVRGNDYAFMPLWYTETSSSGQRSFHHALDAFDLATGARVGWIQSGPIAPPADSSYGGDPIAAADEAGNIYGIWPSSSSSGTGRLYSLTPTGTFRFSVDGVPAGTLAVGSGVVVATSRFEFGHDAVPPLTQLFRTSDGALLVSSRQNILSPVISGNRLSFLEQADTSFTLTSYDLQADRAWRVALGAGSDLEFLPIMQTASGTLVLIQQAGTSAQVRFREFNLAGREVTSCSLPGPPGSGRYTAAVLTAGELVLNSDSANTALAFDAGGRLPAAHGWVTEGGSPARDLRAR
jgi:hypothetical protein